MSRLASGPIYVDDGLSGLFRGFRQRVSIGAGHCRDIQGPRFDENIRAGDGEDAVEGRDAQKVCLSRSEHVEREGLYKAWVTYIQGRAVYS